jgi:hypothetical protein
LLRSLGDARGGVAEGHDSGKVGRMWKHDTVTRRGWTVMDHVPSGDQALIESLLSVPPRDRADPHRQASQPHDLQHRQLPGVHKRRRRLKRQRHGPLRSAPMERGPKCICDRVSGSAVGSTRSRAIPLATKQSLDGGEAGDRTATGPIPSRQQ